mmetsp:Transcript_92581/g.262075  ORF Transcript_92581/g.262075 Transcript_92581/m.262075 type:complete len:822 (+) Transcript_92581:834-3299(+)
MRGHARQSTAGPAEPGHGPRLRQHRQAHRLSPAPGQPQHGRHGELHGGHPGQHGRRGAAGGRLGGPRGAQVLRGPSALPRREHREHRAHTSPHGLDGYGLDGVQAREQVRVAGPVRAVRALPALLRPARGGKPGPLLRLREGRAGRIAVHGVEPHDFTLARAETNAAGFARAVRVAARSRRQAPERGVRSAGGLGVLRRAPVGLRRAHAPAARARPGAGQAQPRPRRVPRGPPAAGAGRHAVQPHEREVGAAARFIVPAADPAWRRQRPGAAELGRVPVPLQRPPAARGAARRAGARDLRGRGDAGPLRGELRVPLHPARGRGPRGEAQLVPEAGGRGAQRKERVHDAALHAVGGPLEPVHEHTHRPRAAARAGLPPGAGGFPQPHQELAVVLQRRGVAEVVRGEARVVGEGPRRRDGAHGQPAPRDGHDAGGGPAPRGDLAAHQRRAPAAAAPVRPHAQRAAAPGGPEQGGPLRAARQAARAAEGADGAGGAGDRGAERRGARAAARGGEAGAEGGRAGGPGRAAEAPADEGEARRARAAALRAHLLRRQGGGQPGGPGLPRRGPRQHRPGRRRPRRRPRPRRLRPHPGGPAGRPGRRRHRGHAACVGAGAADAHVVRPPGAGPPGRRGGARGGAGDRPRQAGRRPGHVGALRRGPAGGAAPRLRHAARPGPGRRPPGPVRRVPGGAQRDGPGPGQGRGHRLLRAGRRGDGPRRPVARADRRALGWLGAAGATQWACGERGPRRRHQIRPRIRCRPRELPGGRRVVKHRRAAGLREGRRRRGAAGPQAPARRRLQLRGGGVRGDRGDAARWWHGLLSDGP